MLDSLTWDAITPNYSKPTSCTPVHGRHHGTKHENRKERTRLRPLNNKLQITQELGYGTNLKSKDIKS